MTTSTTTGVAYTQNQGVLRRVTANYHAVNEDAIIDAASAVTVYLPAEPRPGQRHTLLASGGTITVNGNGHSIAGGVSSVSANTGQDFMYSESEGKWIPLGGSGGVAGNPAPPDRSLQFDDNGVFGGSSWLFVDPDQLYGSLDNSNVVVHDSTANVDLTWLMHDNFGSGGVRLPPGTVLGFGTDQAFSVQPNTSYYYAGKIAQLGVGDGGVSALSVFESGAVFNGTDPAVTISGTQIYPNLIVQGFLQDPSDDLLGGGVGVMFMARAQVVPTTAPVAAAGVLEYVEPNNNKPYGWNSANERFAMFAQEAPVLFGVGTMTQAAGNEYAPPGFAPATAATNSDGLIVMISPCDARLLNLQVIQNVPGVDATNISYTVEVNSVSTTLSATLASNAFAGADNTHIATVAKGDEISVRINKSALLAGAAPQNVVITFSMLPLLS